MTTRAETATPAFLLINPAGLYDPAPNGYSHVAKLQSGARLAFISGQGGENEKGELPADFREQVRQAFNNLSVALDAAGATTRDVAKLTVLIVDHSEEKLHIFGEELSRAFGNAMKPSCTLIPVPRLALDGMLFEIEATAVLAS
ncbi:MAG TPA: RidA family protein [Microvirga sp.]|nr:RidA family protein [Microvirga sp.]